MFTPDTPRKLTPPRTLVVRPEIVEEIEETLPPDAQSGRVQALNSLLNRAFSHTLARASASCPFIYWSLNEMESLIREEGAEQNLAGDPFSNANAWRFGGKLGAVILHHHFRGVVPPFSKTEAEQYDTSSTFNGIYANGFNSYNSNRGVIHDVGTLFSDFAPPGAVERDALTILPRIAAGYTIYLAGVADDYAFRQATTNSTLIGEIEAFLRAQSQD